MKGKDLFNQLSVRDFSGSISDEYAQDLFTIFMHIGNAIFPLMEKAEKLGKKLEVIDRTENGTTLIDDILITDIRLV